MSRKSSKKKNMDEEGDKLFPFSSAVSENDDEVKASDEEEQQEEIAEADEEIAIKKPLEKVPASSGRVLVRSLWPARLVVKAEVTPSGESYTWPRAGAEVSVSESDVSFLLSKNKPGLEGSGCCGGDGRRTYFEIV
jgi:hypothetical protein